MLTVAVTLAAGLGAVCRYLVDGWLRRGPLPWGTLAVNLSGSFLLGLIVGAAGRDVLAVAGVGFAGGFTTLSTWAVETVLLVEHGHRRPALHYLVATWCGGLLAAAAGLALTAG